MRLSVYLRIFVTYNPWTNSQHTFMLIKCKVLSLILKDEKRAGPCSGDGN